MIIGLAGHARSGKDTVARMILDVRRFSAQIAFAEPLKRFCREIFGWTEEHTDGAFKEVEDKRYLRAARGSAGMSTCPPRDVYLTPRFAMQTLGTEWGRRCYPNVWVEYGIRRAQNLLAGEGPQPSITRPALVVISDVRFVNEAKAIRDAGGQVWRIVRPGAEAQGGVIGHASEAELDSSEMFQLCEFTILNDGALEDLHVLVHALLTKSVR